VTPAELAVAAVLEERAYHCVDCLDDDGGSRPVKTVEEWAADTAAAVVEALGAGA